MKTFFELVDESSQAEMADRLDIDKATISRSYRCLCSVSGTVIEACDRVFGDGFDRDRTVVEWFNRWSDRRQGDHFNLPTSPSAPVSSQSTAEA